MFRISGFFDEASIRLDRQLALLKTLGMQYLCPRTVDGKNITDYSLPLFNETVRLRLAAAGAKLSSIGSGIGKIQLHDEKACQAQLRKLTELADIAETAGCRYIRMFSFYMPPGFDEEAVFPQAAEKLRGFLDAIRRRDIIQRRVSIQLAGPRGHAACG